MGTQEITRDEWEPFFDAFSGLHRGWLVTVERALPHGAQLQAFEVPLEEVHAELGASQSEDRIVVVLREIGNELLHLQIAAPTHVRLSQDEAQARGTLEVDSKSGEGLRVRFRHLPLPREVDGWLA